MEAWRKGGEEVDGEGEVRRKGGRREMRRKGCEVSKNILVPVLTDGYDAYIFQN